MKISEPKKTRSKWEKMVSGLWTEKRPTSPSLHLFLSRGKGSSMRGEEGREQVRRRKGEWRIWSRKGEEARETAGLPGALQQTQQPCSSPGEVEAHSPRLSLLMQKVGISREASLILLKRYTCVCVYVRVWVCITWPFFFSSYYVSKEKNKLWNHLSVYSFTHCSPYCKL